MDYTQINIPLLNIDFNKETSKYFWTIYLNDKELLKSHIEFATEKECKLHLISVNTSFKYLYDSNLLIL
jgi:hypothetical protein